MKNNISTYKDIKNKCYNLNNFGENCYENCAFRENGNCELSKNELINLSLKELLNIDLDCQSKNFAWDLLNLVENKKNTNNKRKAIVSGSFDPFTNGHLEIIKQASQMFDELYVVIFINSSKKRNYDVEKMCKAIEKTLKRENLTNCIVDYNDGLLAEYCKDKNIKTTIRGLRNNLDYNYEENIVEVNKLLNENLETIYLRGNGNKISSSTVRELLKYNKDVSKFVPLEILEIIK